MGTCGVDLATKTIRFEGCEDRAARCAAINARIKLLEDMMARSKGFTNRERRAMKAEKDFLEWAFYPNDPIDRRMERWERANPRKWMERRGWANHLRKSENAWAQRQFVDAEWEKHFGHVL
jgi:hypothetical protein